MAPRSDQSGCLADGHNDGVRLNIVDVALDGNRPSPTGIVGLTELEALHRDLGDLSGLIALDRFAGAARYSMLMPSAIASSISNSMAGISLRVRR